MLDLILIGIVVLVVLVLVWPKIKSWLPTGSVTTAINKASLAARQTVAAGGLQAAMQFFSAIGDTATVTALGGYYAKVWAYQEPIVATVAAANQPAAIVQSTDAVANLARQVAELTQQVQSLQATKTGTTT